MLVCLGSSLFLLFLYSFVCLCLYFLLSCVLRFLVNPLPSSTLLGRRLYFSIFRCSFRTRLCCIRPSPLVQSSPRRNPVVVRCACVVISLCLFVCCFILLFSVCIHSFISLCVVVFVYCDCLCKYLENTEIYTCSISVALPSYS